MDSDLFQILTLFLLLVTVIVLLLVFSALNQIKRSLGGREAGGASWAAAPVTETPSYATDVRPAAEEPSVATGFVSVAESAPAETAAAGAGATVAEAEPSEQPYERDGRWWFRRGDELLVYEEATGQWLPAPEEAGIGTAVGAAAAPTVGATGTGVASELSAVAATSAAPVQDAGEGWKCPSCGAINGSTATSCRMCFTPRA